MRRFVSLTTPLAVCTLLAVPSAAWAQERSPELERLSYMVGEWTWDGGDRGTGTDACEWIGSRVLKCDTEYFTPAGATLKMVSVYSYNPQRGYYTWLRYWGNGNLDDHIGWVDGTTWTWMQRDSAGGHYRFINVEVSPTQVNIRAEESVKGGDWQLWGTGTMTKVR